MFKKKLLKKKKSNPTKNEQTYLLHIHENKTPLHQGKRVSNNINPNGRFSFTPARILDDRLQKSNIT